jgi:hypothetical protein
VPGESIINAGHLGDGIHPDDEGHKRIAVSAAKALTAAMRMAAELPTIEALDEPDRTFGGRPGGDDAGADESGAVGPGVDDVDGTVVDGTAVDGDAVDGDDQADDRDGADPLSEIAAASAH